MDKISYNLIPDALLEHRLVKRAKNLWNMKREEWI
jgi:hypothetical protein